jgi:hypothetical protein
MTQQKHVPTNNSLLRKVVINKSSRIDANVLTQTEWFFVFKHKSPSKKFTSLPSFNWHLNCAEILCTRVKSDFFEEPWYGRHEINIVSGFSRDKTDTVFGNEIITYLIISKTKMFTRFECTFHLHSFRVYFTQCSLVVRLQRGATIPPYLLLFVRVVHSVQSLYVDQC